ncbi:MAG TPA: serine hydrolase domain-containing protein [Niabella sp.]|nr:beta-lactamase family protein [Chitinophagaceae bacterium]HRO85227.1 serine hydrolase domain-containing protein [Niabella sp.]HUN02079.1 serine hydrolase domain-containing protein [Niabella sp.]
MVKKLLLAIIVFQISVSSYSQADKAASDIEQLMQETPVMGLSVAVVKNNKLIYTKAYGLKDAELKTPLSTVDIFRIASISKSFSATSIMQLVEKKKLSLDDDVSDLIGFKVRNPQYPDVVITLKMILSHTSSLNDSEGYFSLDAINPSKNNDWQKCYNSYEPGKGYQYCNLNFNMAGTIIERVSGERFDHYVLNHILKPLKLYGGYNVNELNQNLFAKIYEFNIDSAKFIYSPGAYDPRKKEIENYVMGYSAPIFSPTGGMKISAPDLARYMMMYINHGKKKGKKGIISEASAKIMQTPVAVKEGYGLALLKTDKLIKGEIMTGHTGSAYGLFSAMFFNPEKKFGFVVISNGCDPRYSDDNNTTINKVINILYQSFIMH